MSTLDQKIYFIAYFLEYYSFPEGMDSIELSDEEINYLCENFSIRFKQSASGFICYYGPTPGLQGMGDSAFRAFCLMIKSLGFKIHKDGTFSAQLQMHFQEKV